MSKSTLAMLTLFFGWLGSHKFYIKRDPPRRVLLSHNPYRDYAHSLFSRLCFFLVVVLVVARIYRQYRDYCIAFTLYCLNH